MTENYPSAGEVIRNLADLKVSHEVVLTHGKFRIVKIAPPYFGGYEWWVVNERGFLWEPANNEDQALAYLESPEAIEYQETERSSPSRG